MGGLLRLKTMSRLVGSGVLRPSDKIAYGSAASVLVNLSLIRGKADPCGMTNKRGMRSTGEFVRRRRSEFEAGLAEDGRLLAANDTPPFHETERMGHPRLVWSPWVGIGFVGVLRLREAR